MTATQWTGAERRALRWMSRRGVGLQPTEPAFQLLGERLAVRWWVGGATYGALLVFLVVWIWRSPDVLALDALSPVARVAVALVPVGVFALVQCAFVAACRWCDRRIAARLPQRTSRTEAVSVWTVLGRFATLIIGVAVVGHLVVAVALFRGAPRTDAVAYVVGLAAVAVVVAATVTVIVRRPTVAVDDSSLAVDERIRAADALLALWPMYWAALGLSSLFDLHGSDARGVVDTVSFGLAILSSAVWFSHPGELGRLGFGRKGSRA